MSKQNTSPAVMNQRHSALDSLEFFPTPPWATRALLHDVLPDEDWRVRSIWEPAAGERHMVRVLLESCRIIFASDVHDYGKKYKVGSFTGQGPDVVKKAFSDGTDWIITNPPFSLAQEFVQRALGEAKRGVAVLVRANWAEGVERYEQLFHASRPSIIAQFAERVPMVEGRWDPAASTATAYCWFIWLKNESPQRPTEFRWIPPGARVRNTRPDDIARFTSPAAA